MWAGKGGEMSLLDAEPNEGRRRRARGVGDADDCDAGVAVLIGPPV